MRKFGLAAILTFVDRGATAAMGRVGRMARALEVRFRKVGVAIQRVASGLTSFATGAIPATLALGAMVKGGARFEDAFQGVRSVLLDTTGKLTKGLEGLAQTLGSTTVFSASQAAQAMELLARAGLKNQQIMGAVTGTLSAAAAEGIGLADAADVVASAIKAFNLPAEKATTIAGALALVSAKTNTTILGLKEGLKLAAPAARLAGVTFQDTTQALGQLANVGLKGTLAGTAFRAAITKLVKPTKDGRRALAQLGISFAQVRKFINKGNLLGAFTSIGQKLGKIKKDATRANLAMRIFGLRGVTVASAFDLSGKSLTDYGALMKRLRTETGQTAKAMAEIRLKTVTGQVTLLKSAFEAVSIQIFKLLAPSLAGGVKSFATTLGDLALAMRVVAGERFTRPEDVAKVAGISKAMLGFARGVRDAFVGLRNAVASVVDFVGKLVAKFRALPESTQRKIAKVASAAFLVLAVMGPLVAAVGLFVFVLKGAALALVGLLSPAIAIPAAFAAIGVAIVGPKNALEALRGLVLRVKNLFSGLFQGLRESKAFNNVKDAVTSLVGAFGNLIDAVFGVSGSAGQFKTFGQTVGSALGTVLKVASALVKVLASLINLAAKLAAVLTSGGVGALGAEVVRRKRTLDAGGTFVPAPTTGERLTGISEALKAVGTATGLTGLPTAARTPVRAPAGARAPVTPPTAALQDRGALAAGIVSQVGATVAPRARDPLGLGGGADARTPSGTLTVKVPLQVDGREMAMAIARVKLDDLERSGENVAAGTRSSLLQRGFAEGP